MSIKTTRTFWFCFSMLLASAALTGAFGLLFLLSSNPYVSKTGAVIGVMGGIITCYLTWSVGIRKDLSQNESKLSQPKLCR